MISGVPQGYLFSCIDVFSLYFVLSMDDIIIDFYTTFAWFSGWRHLFLERSMIFVYANIADVKEYRVQCDMFYKLIHFQIVYLDLFY